jgi:uncharacterized membrane protein
MSEIARKLSPRILAPIFVAVLFVSSVLTAAVTPPFQSPDEFAHVQRAYLLSKGTVLLDASGGMIDTGLVSYMDVYQRYPFHPHRKVSPEIGAYAENIEWSGTKAFVFNPTAAYFPIAYAPQAFGLAVGEALSLPIDTSYRLARFFALLASLGLLLLAFRIFNPPLIVMGLLIIPMSLFQISSASLDGVANSTAILAISAFTRAVVDKRATRPWVLWILCASVFTVVASREYLAPLLLLVFGAFHFTRDRKYIFAGLFLACIIAAWVWVAMASAFAPSPSGLTLSEGLAFYATHPLLLAEVFLRTLADDFLFYAASFVGILGWLDTQLRMIDYAIFCVLILSLLVASLRFRGAAGTRGARALLVTSSIASILIVFLWMLIAWTQHPASTILGIQGRYFFVPVAMVAYALAFGRTSSRKPGSRRLWGILVLVVLVVYSVATTTQALSKRYDVSTKYLEASHTASMTTEPQYGNLVTGRIAEPSFVAKGGEGWWASRDYSYNEGVAIGSDYVRVRSVDGSVYVYPW